MKATYKILSLILFILFHLHSYSQSGEKVVLNLRQACEMGITNNVNVKNSGIEADKNQYKLKETKSKLYPQLEGYSNFSYYYAIPKMVIPGEFFGKTGMIPVEVGTTFDWASGFKATQILYNQSYFTSIKMVEKFSTLQKLDLQQRKEEVIYQVTQLYHLIQTTNRQVNELNTSLKNNEKLLAIAKVQTDNGMMRKVDYSRVEVNNNNIQTQVDNLIQLSEQQLGMLKILIGIDASKLVQLSDSLATDIDILQDASPDFTQHSSLQYLDKQIDISLLEKKMDKQLYLPSLSAFGQYYVEGQRNKFDYFNSNIDNKYYTVGVVGISLNVPIFDGLEKKYKSKQKELEIKELRNIKENTTHLLTKDYNDAVRQLELSKKLVARQLENIKSAESTYQVSVDGYKQQVTPLTDVLMAESGLTEARLSYYNAILQYNNATLDVKKACGKLLNF